MATTQRRPPSTTPAVSLSEQPPVERPTEAPIVLEEKENVSVRPALLKKTLDSPLGLGTGLARRLTEAGLLALLLLAVAAPAAYLKAHQRLPFFGSANKESSPRQLASSTQGDEAPVVAKPRAQRVPLTEDLQASFYALQYTRSQGILLAVSQPDWSSVRDRFIDAVKTVRSSDDEQGDPSAKLRLWLAMDLACLENEVVVAQAAIDCLSTTSSGGEHTLQDVYEAKMKARHNQAVAADLWEARVKAGDLGSDSRLQDKICKMLAAVRSRATASEYLTRTLLHAHESAHEGEATVRRLFAEANRAYEAVASLDIAGQLAATDPLISEEVANWCQVIRLVGGFSAFPTFDDA
ncbi:hypothetical protein Esti_005881 [Eimeria stiedai]